MAGQGGAGQGATDAATTAVKNLLLPVACTGAQFLTEGSETRLAPIARGAGHGA